MNKTFLGEVAEDLFERYGTEVGELKMLFPSRRGRIFFTDAISQIATQPIWEPEWVSIDEMMCRISGIEVGEHIRLIAELFQIYKTFHKNETFDRFYYWGEVLLADFDMVDKYLIDAEQIFRNISDIKELETDLSYLTPQQMQIVAFWSSIGDGQKGVDLSLHKERFLVVWRSLLPIYKAFRRRLTELKIAYPGMVHRTAAERIKSGEAVATPKERYVIAGFNALSECEKVLFNALKQEATTHFYWDWDDYYSESSKQEAGLFLKQNRAQYSAAKEISHNNFTAKPKSIEAIACSSTSLQCKYVATILDEITRTDGCVDKRTAIVLTDESLLLPLLYALPRDIGKVNVTMGYPLRDSLAYSFIERLIELQHHARRSKSSGEESLYHIDVVGILSHPYLRSSIDENLLIEIEDEIEQKRLIAIPTTWLHRNELLKEIFTTSFQSWRERSEYLARVVSLIAAQPLSVGGDAEMRVEFLSFLLDHILGLQHSIEECNVQIEISTYISLLRRHLQPLRIPFEGEPLEGVQVMGILETRSLDFDNVILLSMNDDNFPSSRVTQPSYIPYTLRTAFELPTPEHHDGVYAYYFYRLIQRAHRVHMLYCSRADEKSTGEQSRYITQLEMESPFEIKRTDVGVDVNLYSSSAIEIEKSGEVLQKLRDIRRLSPTALFQYIACPLRFYYKSIARIRTQDELTDEVDSPMFGNILHDSMERLYSTLVERDDTLARLQRITKGDVTEAVNLAIRRKYLMNEESKEEFSANILLIREVVVNYIIGGVLRYDIANPPQRILAIEGVAEKHIKFGESSEIVLHGVCDRVDKMEDGSIRIVDYKTGSPHLDFAGIEALFRGEGRDRQSNIFQALLYSLILRQEEEENLQNKRQKITPSLYYVRMMNNPEYSPLLCNRERMGEPITEYEPTHEEFNCQLLATLEELFDETIPFRECDDTLTCEYCDYRSLCRRETRN